MRSKDGHDLCVGKRAGKGRGFDNPCVRSICVEDWARRDKIVAGDERAVTEVDIHGGWDRHRQSVGFNVR